MKAIIKRRYKLIFFISLSILIAVTFSRCQKVINVDLNEAAPKIVIEGIISDRRGPYTVTVSRSGSYFNQPSLERVTDAVIVIKDNTNAVDTLKETSPGIYLTKTIKGFPGRTYSLTVISDKIEYSATSTMLSHVNIDSLTLLKSTSDRFDFGGNRSDRNYEIHCFFKDPPEKNYYRLKVYRNDSINTESYRIYDDQYTNGRDIELRATHASAGNSYRIELLSIDKSTYQYYRTLEDLLNANPLFGSTPANPDTNLSNGALGYFGAYAVSSKTVTITQALINSLK